MDFTTAFHLNQGDKTARSNRAAAFNLIGDHAAAVQDCLAELVRGPVPYLVGAPYLNAHLGYAYMRLGDLDKAIAAFRVAIEVKRDYRRAYDLLAQCLRDKGSTAEAQEVMTQGAAFELKSGGNESIFMYFLY
jgi:tetratricopeptide (TPR) repeat protein